MSATRLGSIVRTAGVVALAAAGACASTSNAGGAASGNDADAGCASSGRAWAARPAFTSADLVTVFEPAPADVWIQGDVLHRSQGGAPFAPICVAAFCGGGEMTGSCGPMAQVACNSGTSEALHGSGLWGTSASDVWAGTSYRAVAHWDGQSWTSFFTGDNRQAGTFWGTSSEDVWGVDVSGNGYRGHWDGRAWSHDFNITAGAVWGADPAHYWSAEPGVRSARELGAAATGRIQSWSGNDDPQTVLTTTAPLYGIWGTGVNDVWVVGAGGAIEHWDGAAWTAAPSPTTHDLHAVWGHGASDVWAVGAAGTIVHYDGRSWTSAPSPTSSDLYSIAGRCADAWAVGASGALLELR